ncbi:MAG: M14 family zinc carboxypeptidase [candidate division WOR-3 bacterium]
MKFRFSSLLIILLPIFSPGNPQPRDLIRITNACRNDVRNIETTGAWVNYVDQFGVVAEATTFQQQQLKNRGYLVQVLTPDISGIYERHFTGSDGRYLTYNEFIDTMALIARNNPAICQLETLGTSYNGNLLLGMKISDQPQIHENEPAVHFEGAIHGDEKIGWAICFELLKYLVRNYGTDTLITRLVDTREIYIIPMYNPDGYIRSSRYNGNSVDLNRNWGWMWGDESNQGISPFSEPENQALLNHIQNNPAAIFVSYHAGTTFISHPWSYCYSYQNTIPELSLIQFLSARYDYWTSYTYGQGCDSMYPINGSTKDFDYGYGMMGWSIEVHPQKTPPASEIDPCFNLNLPAMLEFIHLAGRGIHGTVTDATTGQPVPCQVWVRPADWLSYNHPGTGDFHRFYLPGTYTLTFRAPGYRDTTIEDVLVPATGDSAVIIDVQLTPDPAAPLFAFRHIYNSFVNPSTNRTYPVRALGPRDDSAFLLDHGKTICLDMHRPVFNRDGPDLIVYRAAGTGSTQVQGANNWQGPWITIGSASAPQTELDIGSAGLDSVRYLKLTASGQFYLDAIEGINNVGIARSSSRLPASPLQFKVKTNPASGAVHFFFSHLPDKPVLLIISDPGGRIVKTLNINTKEVVWDGRTQSGTYVPAGIYFARIGQEPAIRIILLK